jgi:xanthine dehydrogenase accessory factor
MSEWIAPLRAALAQERRVVLVTLAACRGSTPREPGAKMIVTPKGLHGSIGGGHLEFEAISIARTALADRASGAWLVRFPLAARLGQCCGGVATLLFQSVDADTSAWLDELADRGTPRVLLASRIAADAPPPRVLGTATLAQAGLPPDVHAVAEKLLAGSDPAPALAGEDWFVETLVPPDFRVVVFGNGHVGRALVQILGTLPCAVTWVDEREDDFPDTVSANVEIVATDAPDDEVRRAAPGSAFLVMTHNHALDLELTRVVLGRNDFSYLGLIGSASKRAQFARRLAARGVPREAIARITCPIGLPGIHGKEPGAIAVAVAAELLQLRERHAAFAGDAHGADPVASIIAP